MIRRFLVAANWKLNGSKESIKEICNELTTASLDSKSEIVIASPGVYISYVRELLPKKFSLAAQNCYKFSEGDYTGEISPAMIKDIGADWVLLGQSERRYIFDETVDLIGEKIKHALEEGLKVMVCIGENLEQRNANQTVDVLSRQLSEIAHYVKDWTNITLVYEPLWAFGTDEIPTAEEVQHVHRVIRKYFWKNVSIEVSEMIRILYGGSVTKDDCVLFSSQSDVDGFLLDYASMKSVFIHIINSTELCNCFDFLANF